MNSPVKEKYLKEARAELMEELGVDNLMAVPKIERVVVNVGVGKIASEKDKVEAVISDLRKITGQQPVRTKAKKSISGFKSRQGATVGIKVNLRRMRMWQFIDRFIGAALPRVRDFQGISLNSVDQNGNLSVGIKEQIIFPEIIPDQVSYIFPLQVNVVTTARSKDKGIALFRALGFPLQSSQTKNIELEDKK